MKHSMAQIQITGLKTDLMPVIAALHRLGCVQIEDLATVDSVSAQPFALPAATRRTDEHLTQLVARLEGVLAALGLGEPTAGDLDGAPDCTSVDAAYVEETLASVQPEVKQLVARRDALQAEQTALPRYIATLRRLLPIIPPSAQDPQNVTVGVLVGRAHRWVLDALTESALLITAGQAETAVGHLDESTLAMVIVFEHKWQPEIERLLGREDISRLRLPDMVAGQPPEQALQTLSLRLMEIPGALAAVRAECDALAQEWEARLQLWLVCLRDRLDEIEVLARLGETEHAFVLVGWTPADAITAVTETLRQTAGDMILLEILPLQAADERRVPVILDNPPPARPFESLVRLYRLPRFSDIDPTLLVALFMPMFFGMILGDIGYGGVLLLLCLVGLRKFRQSGTLRDVIKILAIGSGWAIVFGFLYGEFFGTLGERFGLHPILFDRADAHEVTALLAFAIVVGVVHVVLGLVLGVWTAVRERSRHHLLERGGTLLGLVGLFLLVAALADWLPLAFRTPAVVVLLLGIVLLSVSYGWLGLLLGPIEFVGVLGNILSYLRIAAVGLASVYVARLANELAGVVGVVAVGVIIALLVHALNLVLGAFSPTIHSLRLQYVEFFRKFYEGGGEPFAPFRSRIAGGR